MTQRSPLYVRIPPREWPRDLLTWVSRGPQLGIQPTPFIQRQLDWPNPVLARPNHDLRTWANALPPGVVGNPVPPIRNYDWPNPTLRIQSFELRTWVHSQQLTPPTVMPFGQADWPNPWGPQRNQDLTWIDGLPQTALALTLPQRQTEWPNPTLAQPLNITLRSWINGLPAGQISLTVPPVQLDWPNPQPLRANLELRSWTFALQQQPAVQSAFSQFDWPNPAPLRESLELRSWVFADSTALLSVVFVTVPNVVGETQAQATTDIQAQGLTVNVSTAYSSTVAAGLVISQVPGGGTQVSSGSSVAIVISLGEQPVSANAGAGRSRRRRLFVQIDGQDFPVESVEHAQALLDQAKALARRIALEKAEERLTVHLATNPRVRPKIERPRIVTHNPELHFIVAQTREVISNVYKAAYRDAEIGLRLAEQLRNDDEDDEDDEDLLMLL